MARKTDTTVKITGDLIPDDQKAAVEASLETGMRDIERRRAIRDAREALLEVLTEAEVDRIMPVDLAPENTAGAFPDETLRLFDGWVVKLAQLNLTGAGKLYLGDDVHAALLAAAKINDAAAIRVTVAGQTFDLLGTISAHGVQMTPKGLRENLTVKVTGSLGSSGHEVDDDA